MVRRAAAGGESVVDWIRGLGPGGATGAVVARPAGAGLDCHRHAAAGGWAGPASLRINALTRAHSGGVGGVVGLEECLSFPSHERPRFAAVAHPDSVLVLWRPLLPVAHHHVHDVSH